MTSDGKTCFMSARRKARLFAWKVPHRSEVHEKNQRSTSKLTWSTSHLREGHSLTIASRVLDSILLAIGG